MCQFYSRSLSHLLVSFLYSRLLADGERQTEPCGGGLQLAGDDFIDDRETHLRDAGDEEDWVGAVVFQAASVGLRNGDPVFPSSYRRPATKQCWAYTEHTAICRLRGMMCFSINSGSWDTPHGPLSVSTVSFLQRVRSACNAERCTS